MNDEAHGEGGAPGNGAALNAALSAVAGSEEARTLLRKQARLVDLQIADLEREDKIRHWSLRIRHVSGVLKLGFELAAAFIVLLLAVGLGLIVWQAVHADGLVIDTFNVPAPMAQTGLTGQVIANKLLDRLTVLQNETDSSRAPSSYANDWTNQITVQIPDTGISLGQVVRFLDGWLGHQMHLSGDLYAQTGGAALTVRIDNDPGQTFVGNPSMFDAMLGRAAEAVYARAQPYRYSVFLADRNRYAESARILRLLETSRSTVEAEWAHVGLAILLIGKGDVAGARGELADAENVNPSFPNAVWICGILEGLLSHDEASFADETRTVRLLNGAGARELDTAALPALRRSERAFLAAATADFAAASADNVVSAGTGGDEVVYGNAAFFSVSEHDIAATRRAISALDAMRTADPMNPALTDAPLAQGNLDADLERWRAAVWDFDAAITQRSAMDRATGGWQSASLAVERTILPSRAYALAKSGDFTTAGKILNALPVDCDLCARMHGRVEAVRKNWSAAAHWFALVEARSPDIPFADTDWGAMLLRKGDYEGAIAKFEQAHAKGPHFADPLEMWGEALMAKNRSDLALAKFEEADKYAPNWGRLHLEWGNALYYVGKKGEAQQQFDVASHLDLTPAEHAVLASLRAGHG